MVSEIKRNYFQESASNNVSQISARTSSISNQWKAQIKKQNEARVVTTEVELPSGVSVRAMRPPLMLLMDQGKIPDSVTPLVHEMIRLASTGGEDSIQDMINKKVAEDPIAILNQVTQLQTAVWLAAVVEPIFVKSQLEIDENQIPLETLNRLNSLPEEDRIVVPMSDVAQEDLAYFFMWAQGLDKDLESFRKEWEFAVSNTLMG